MKKNKPYYLQSLEEGTRYDRSYTVRLQTEREAERSREKKSNSTHGPEVQLFLGSRVGGLGFHRFTVGELKI